MRNIPLEVMLSWPVPNYQNPVTRGPGLLILNSVLISIVTITVLLRLYVRVYLLRWFGIDDFFIILALLCSIGLTACVILANENYGWDRHIWDLPVHKFAGALKIAWATKIIFSAAACFTRMSLLLYYYRLVHNSNLKWFRTAIHVATFVSLTTMFGLILLTVLQCFPIRAFWTFPAMGHCLDEGVITLAGGIINTFADLLVTVIPIPLIAKLQLPLRRRVGAIVLVSLGFIVCIAGAVRAYYTWLSLISSYDQTWYCYGVWISAAIEIDLGVICACAPALRLVFVKFAAPRLATLSGHLSNLSPFNSNAPKNMETTGSTASDLKFGKQPGCFPDLKQPVTTTQILRETEFVVTTDVSTKYRLDEENYLWDEPWTGDNGPRHTHETMKSEYTRPETAGTAVSSYYEVAKPIRMTRMSASTKVSTSSKKSGSGSGLSVSIPEQRGIGILPDTVAPKYCNDTDEHDVGSCLPIQGSIMAKRPMLPDQRPSTNYQHSRKSSWLDFDFEVPVEARPKTGDPAVGRTKNRLSWLDDNSRDSIDQAIDSGHSRGGSSELSEKIGRERVRVWDDWQRGEELGWDLSGNHKGPQASGE